MKPPQPPRLETRRTREFSAELQERARAWIPSWEVTENEGDFGRALLEIAARFNSEVAERLDRSGEKMRRGFLDWLAVRREAARPSRMPVVFKLIDAAREPVLASAPVRMQADAGGTPVVFETENDVRLIPGRLDTVIGADADEDAFYLPPPGMSDLKPDEPMPTQWQLKSFASAGANKIQLDPELGLVPEMLIRANGQEYKVIAVDKDLVTIEPPLASDLTTSILLTKVTTFSPFDGGRNWQEHVLYLGDAELLNIEAPATIDVVGALSLREGITWEYWGKVDPNEAIGWQPLELDEERQPTVNDAIALKKPKGAVEEKEINGKNSRWIRAYTKKVSAARPLITSDEFSIRINATGCNGSLPCPPDDTTQSPVAEAMANTTPLVLDNVFFPLGKEPRQFDAFYLGSEEAFSKLGANVQLCFEMADPTFASLSLVNGGAFAKTVLAGVGQDRALHLFSFNPTTGAIAKFLDRDPLQPPIPGFLGQTPEGLPVALDPKPPWRLPVWNEPDPVLFPGFPFASFVVGVTAGNAIWMWRENEADRTQSGWVNFGELPLSAVTPSPPIDGLVFLGVQRTLAALRGGELFLRDWPTGAEWTPVDTLEAGNPVTLASIVPVFIEDPVSGELVTDVLAGMVGISTTGDLFHVATNGVCTPLPGGVGLNTAIRPVAVEVGGDLVAVAATDSDPPDLIAVHSSLPLEQTTLPAGTKLMGALDVVLAGGTVHVLASIRGAGNGALISWAPFETGAAAEVLESLVGASGGAIGGAPTLVDGHVVIPGDRADVLVTDFDLDLRVLRSATIETGVVVPDSVPSLNNNDLIVLEVANAPESRFVTNGPITKTGETFYAIDSQFPNNASGPVLAYRLSDTLTGTFTGPDQFELDATDHQTQELSWLLIDGAFYTVDDLDTVSDPWVATISSPTGGPMPAAGTYVRPLSTGGRVTAFMELDTSPGQNGDWDADLLKQMPLIFPNKNPEKQTGKAFKTAVGNKPMLVVLASEFQSSIAAPFDFLIDAAVGEWRRQLGDTSTNPELSWEYGNGRGWWKLPIKLDETLNLKTKGRLQFSVPADIAPTDWAGRTNFWIRARLIGGDYGQEQVTVTTTEQSPGVTKQTVDRSREGIRPPAVVRLHISYAICEEIKPNFVLAQDSGTVRDQSDANRTPGAIVEAFIPLSYTLGRLSQNLTVVDESEECPPECSCSEHSSDPAQTQPETTATTSLAGVPTISGRSLFIGLDATPSEEPVNVLLLVDERNHTAFAPVKVEALIGNSFQPVVVNDTTRALGESGLLSMSFPVSPTPSELFGKTLTWLRLVPKQNATDDWIPVLRGAYLNAAWASATETLTRELIGSSDGAPNLRFRLARPPVLLDTLELRVREPLGDEEREALFKQDPNIVVNDPNLPGDWVLWTQVVDPNDEAADARVYALDEATGEIRFGDGTHGRIPPIGRDAIVAFSYSRTEIGDSGSETVPGNTIGPRTTLNLVSPVETVETVTSADQAAGGAPAELDERVLRFGFARLRHRNRAVTARDLEDLALQSSPDIVQARAIVGRGFVKLVIVMRGDDPQPTAAQIRELRRFLLESAPAALSAPGALRIEGPKVRRLQIALELRIETLDHAGALGEFVEQQLKSLFDTASGGIDKDGWPLGLDPTEDDIAFVLIDAPHLESIGDVKLREVVSDNEMRPWEGPVKANEIVMLADDLVRIEFETAEVLV